MFKGKLPIQPQFFYSHNDVIKKNFVIKTEMKKVMMILTASLFVRCFLYTGLSHCRGRHSGGGGGFTEASVSVIPVDWCIIY